MTTSTKFNIIHTDTNNSEISGILRLPSPLAYEEHFKEIITNISTCNTPSYSINLIDLTFLNSSGITALARIIIQARQHDQHLEFIGNNAIPWQKKSLSNLQRLWSGVSIKFQ